MNWLAKIFAIIPMVPGVVQGIEQIHGDATSGADKKTLALEALGLAGAAASAAAPGEAPIVSAATSFVSNLIDQSVALFNQIGWAHKTQPAPTTTQAPTPATPSAPTAGF